MKADDPKLEQSRKQAHERLQRINDMMLTVLKNHIMVEQFLNDFLAASKRSRKHSFAGKIDIAERLEPKEIDGPVWQLLRDCNKLRNQIAHQFDESKAHACIAAVRKSYQAALTPRQAEAVKELNDIQMVSCSFELCAAYVVAATDGRKDGGRAPRHPPALNEASQ